MILAGIFTGFGSRVALAENQDRNVILLMVDGVRWQEVFRGADPWLAADETNKTVFPGLNASLKEHGALLGNVDQGSELTLLSRVRTSMSSYMNIMAGSKQFCLTNSCGRTWIETFPERIRRALNLPIEKVATISSWGQIGMAVEHQEGATFVNAGRAPLVDSSPDEELLKLNDEQLKEPLVWEDCRSDKLTFAQGLRYLKKHRPRFLFISLNDSDEWAHAEDYPKYLATLRQYDEWIQELNETLKSMGEYGANTLLLVTTDHGRGSGGNWGRHGILYPDSKYFWLYGNRRGIQPVTPGQYSQANIRPTIETYLGLQPRQCWGCPGPIQEVLPGF